MKKISQIIHTNRDRIVFVACVIMYALSLSGCVSHYQADFKNSEGKIVGACSGSSWGVVGTYVATKRFEECKEKARQLGYNVIDQAQ